MALKKTLQPRPQMTPRLQAFVDGNNQYGFQLKGDNIVYSQQLGVYVFPKSSLSKVAQMNDVNPNILQLDLEKGVQHYAFDAETESIQPLGAYSARYGLEVPQSMGEDYEDYRLYNALIQNGAYDDFDPDVDEFYNEHTQMNYHRDLRKYLVRNPGMEVNYDQDYGLHLYDRENRAIIGNWRVVANMPKTDLPDFPAKYSFDESFSPKYNDAALARASQYHDIDDSELMAKDQSLIFAAQENGVSTIDDFCKNSGRALPESMADRMAQIEMSGDNLGRDLPSLPMADFEMTNDYSNGFGW